MHRGFALLLLCASGLSAHINELVPAQTTAGAAAFTLRAIGVDFIPEEYLQWNGTRLETSFISETELRATVPAALIRSAGTYTVTLAGGGSGGGTYIPGGGGGGGNSSAPSSKPFVVNPPLVITSNSPLPAATPGAAYSQPLFRTGGTAPFSWTVTEGSLPSGLALDRAAGIIRGTAPTTPATANFTVRVADAPDTSTTKRFTLTVGTGGTPPPALTCVVTPQNTMIAVHHPLNHRAGQQLYPDHTFSVIVTGPNGPVPAASVSAVASQTLFPDDTGLPVRLSATVPTNAQGAAEFRHNPPAATSSDRTDVTVSVRAGNDTATCTGTIVVGVGTLTAISQSITSAGQTAGLTRDDFLNDIRQLGDEFREIVAANPHLEDRALRAYERFEPLVQSVLAGGKVALQSAEVERLVKLLTIFSKQGSPELRRTLHKWATGLQARDAKVEYQKRADWRQVWKAAAAVEPKPADRPSAGPRQHLSFESNQGQAGDGIYFLARGSYRSALFAGDGITMSGATGAPLRMSLGGRKHWPKPEALDPLPSRSHYITGSDPRAWKTNVPHYARLRYSGIYPGTDLIFYGDGGQLRYDFILAPGAKPDAVVLHFDGAGDLEPLAGGELLLHHRGGSTRLGKPFAYQERGGQRIEIASRYVGRGKNGIGFELGEYDRSLPLVIDPIVNYSTFAGGNGEDAALAVAVDNQGSAYIAGVMTSATAPGLRPVQPDAAPPGPGNAEAFVTKFTPDGTGVVYTTYFGGSATDFAAGIAVDAAGNAYVAGSTLSANFPIVGGVQPTFGGGSVLAGGGDGFVLKLNPTGSAIIYSTYLGGSAPDVAKAIAVDAAGNAYVTGFSASANFPTRNPIQPGLRGGVVSKSDAFSLKLNAAGNALLYSTLLGGRGDDLGLGIAVDQTGAATIAGVTYSTDFPVDKPLQRASAGFADGFLTRLDPQGAALTYSTYLGGENDDFALAVALDAAGNAYVAGSTGSTRYPTVNAAQAKLAGERSAGFDAFVTKVAVGGQSIVYSTYLGGSGIDMAQSIAVTSEGAVFIAGETDSPDFPTSNAVRAPGGRNDAFLTSLNPAGNNIEHSTYLGGGSLDSAAAVAVDRGGNAYVAGSSSSTDYPVTPGSSQSLLGGRTDAFAVKVGPGSTRPPLRAQPAAARATGGGLAADSIVSLFAPGLAPRVEIAPAGPLPASLAGVSVNVRDAKGVTLPAPLFFVSPGQINLHLPAGLAPGFAVLAATSAGQIVAEGTARIDAVAPTLFSANSTGSGAPAGIAIRAASDGAQTRENLFTCATTAASCRPAPIALRDGEAVYLLLFGTGLRGRTSLAGVQVTVGGVNVPVAYAGEQGEAPGFDQINAGPLPRELAGRGTVELTVTVDGQRANALEVHIQ